MTAAELVTAERVGDRVRALVISDAAHTRRGTITYLSPFAPVALVRWHCGCSTLVPLRRLVADTMPAPVCEASSCDRPRWDGPYCPAHTRPASPARRTGASFEPECAMRVAPVIPGRARNIDDLGLQQTSGRAR